MARRRRKRAPSGLRERLPDELIDELLAGARTGDEIVVRAGCSLG